MRSICPVTDTPFEANRVSSCNGTVNHTTIDASRADNEERNNNRNLIARLFDRDLI